MPWTDFLDELQTDYGLDPEQLFDVILGLPQNAEERRRRERERARERARALLLNHLDEQQRAQFEQGERFLAVGSEGGRYCVHLGRAHNIWLLNEQNQHTTNYCIHLRDQVPDEDNVLAQTLLIESDEREFLRMANRS